MKKKAMTRSEHELSRRAFLEATGAAAVVAAATATASASTPEAVQPSVGILADPSVPGSTIRITVNGVAKRIQVEDRWTLVELLRDHLGLTGTKIGCDRGECGACTVLADGKTIYSCSNLAVWMDGKSIVTVEGVAHQGGALDPLQRAFVEHDAAQCGFCTSGQLMSAKALLASNPHPTADEARVAMSGNLCRCSNYNRYIEAVVAAGNATRSTATGGRE